MFQEAAADLTEVRLLLVELLFQAFQELPLKSVDLLNIAKDGTKLLFVKHVCPLAALFDVTLRKTETTCNTYATTYYTYNKMLEATVFFFWRDPDLTDVFQMFDVVPLCAHDLIDDVGPHLLFAG